MVLFRCVNDVDAIVDTGTSTELAVTVYNIDREGGVVQFLSATCPNPLNLMRVRFSSCVGFDGLQNLASVCTIAISRSEAIAYSLTASAFLGILPTDVVKLDVILECV
jgi:hypothetical protein